MSALERLCFFKNNVDERFSNIGLIKITVIYGQDIGLTRYLQMCKPATKSWLLQDSDCHAKLIRDGAHEHTQRSISVTSMILDVSLSHTSTSNSVHNQPRPHIDLFRFMCLVIFFLVAARIIVAAFPLCGRSTCLSGVPGL
jgi:hypothetical protein